VSAAFPTATPADRGRIGRRFDALRREGRAGLITFITAGDPDHETGLALLKGLPGAGADLIELGMPFTDPMADGPAIQASSLRALKAGARLTRTLEMVREFRRDDTDTPLILMGYYNPIHAYGVERFLSAARAAGVDGLIIVDLPPEEDAELCLPALRAGLDFIRLTAPTTDERRLPAVLANMSGFVYYVSVAGITGTRTADDAAIRDAVERLRRHTELPVAVGFGIATPEQAAKVARMAEGVVVGSAIVRQVEMHLAGPGADRSAGLKRVLSFVSDLAGAVRTARG